MFNCVRYTIVQIFVSVKFLSLSSCILSNRIVCIEYQLIISFYLHKKIAFDSNCLKGK